MQKPKFTKLDRKYMKIAAYLLAVVLIAILFEKVIGNITGITKWISEGFYLLQTLTRPFLYGFAIAYLMNPFVRFFEKRLKILPVFAAHPKGARTTSILLNYLIVIGGLICILFIFVPELKDSLLLFGTQVPSYASGLNLKIEEFFGQIEIIDAKDVNDAINRLMEPLIGISKDMPRLLETILTNVYSFSVMALNLIMAIFIAFYMLYDKEGFQRQWHKVLYALSSERRAEKICDCAKRINHIFQSFIVGKAIDSLIIGILAFIGFTIIDSPFPALLALIVGVTNMIPYFGPFLGAIPAILITFLISPLQSIWVAIFILILQQFDGNFLGPKILGNTLELSPLWIILAIIVGGALMGPLGMFIGVPVFASIKMFWSDYVNRKYAEKYSRLDPLHMLEEKKKEREP